MKEEKISGSWLQQEEEYTDKELITFHGSSSCYFDNLQEQAKNFAKELNNNLTIQNFKHNEVAKKYGHNQSDNINSAYTIIQSFQLDANKDLTPRKVHKMGGELLDGYTKYLKENFNYQLESGFISTHIDRDDMKATTINGKPKVLSAHLHNHIVVPAVNSKGDAIAPYLSKTNIMDIRQMNDKIIMDNNLNDFYLSKLHSGLKPNQAIVNNPNNTHQKQNRTDIQNAIDRFSYVNSHIKFKAISSDFEKSKQFRDNYLKNHYGYQEKIVPYNNIKNEFNDITPGNKKVFTMKDFQKDKNNETKYYSNSNLGILNWNTREQAIAFKDINTLDFDNMGIALQSPKEYKDTLKNSFIKGDSIKESIQFVKETSNRDESKDKSQKKNLERDTSPQTDFLKNLMDASQMPPPQFNFKVGRPLHYVSDDFSKKMNDIKEEYAKLMRNQYVAEEERTLKGKVQYVNRNENITEEQRTQQVNSPKMDNENKQIMKNKLAHAKVEPKQSRLNKRDLLNENLKSEPNKKQQRKQKHDFK